MKITDLKQQVSRPSRYSVYIDDKFSFGLSANAVLDSGLIVGEELDEQRLTELKALSANDKAYTNALRYVTMRQRSEWEMVTYLRRKKVDKELADEIIAKLYELRLLDDLSFARAWITNRRLLKATNKRRLGQELRQKHVSASVIDTALGEDDTDETAVLRELVAKKRRIPRYRNDDLKLMQYLARQGYSYDAIKSALNKNDEDFD
jgi:regulatory protein